MLSIRKFTFQTFNIITTFAWVAFAILDLNVCMATPAFYVKYAGTFDVNSPAAFLFLIAFSFMCFFLIPALASKWLFREKLRDLGLRIPQDKVKALLLIMAGLLLLMPLMYYSTRQSDFRAFYTMKHPTLLKMTLMIMLFPIYYFAEEFFFRGFLFLGLWHKIKWHSFWVTEIIFTLSHIYKPPVEILLCIPASVIFNCLSLYTRSFYPALIVHTTLGVFSLILINYQQITLF